MRERTDPWLKGAIKMNAVIEKFLRYVKMDTESCESDVVPSTEKQKDLARLLVKELGEMGASDIRFDEEHCYVYATIPSNLPEGQQAPTVGFIAHMDTSPAVSGANVNPRIVEGYAGGDIVLNEEKRYHPFRTGKSGALPLCWKESYRYRRDDSFGCR